jgi:hypothetical protein
MYHYVIFGILGQILRTLLYIFPDKGVTRDWNKIKVFTHLMHIISVICYFWVFVVCVVFIKKVKVPLS